MAATIEIGIVTDENRPDLTDSDRLLLCELRERGHRVEPVVWTDEEAEWKAKDLLVVRSCYEYYTRPEAFRAWIDRMESLDVVVANPPSVLRWNMHKFYLRDLIDAGVDVLPTAFIEQGTDVELGTLLRKRGWEEAVVKPAIATSSAGAWKTSLEVARGDRQHFEADLATGDRLVQEFAPEIADGERSLVFLDESFSHAWLSVPASDEYRSHHRFGGSTTAYDPPDTIVEEATSVLEVAREVLQIEVRLPYARVDGIERNGHFSLMELELLEPYLGLGRSNEAATRLADALERYPETSF